MTIIKIALFTVIYRIFLILWDHAGCNNRPFHQLGPFPLGPGDLILDIGERVHQEGIKVEHYGDDRVFTRVHTVKKPFRVLGIAYGNTLVWKAGKNDQWCDKASTHFLNRVPLVTTVYTRTKEGGSVIEAFSMQSGRWVSSKRRTSKPVKIELKGLDSVTKPKTIEEIPTRMSIVRDDLLFGNMAHVDQYDERVFRKSKVALLDVLDIDHGKFDIIIHTTDKFSFYEITPKVGHRLQKIMEGKTLVCDLKPGERSVRVWYFPRTNVASVVRLVIANSGRFYHKILAKYGRTWEPIGLDIFHLMTEEGEDEPVSFDPTKGDTPSKFFAIHGKPASVPYTVYIPNLQVKTVGVYYNGAQVWRAKPGEYCICALVDYNKMPSYISITVLGLKSLRELFFVRAGAIWKGVDQKAYPDKHKLYTYSSFYNANIAYICKRMIEELNKNRIIEYNPNGGSSSIKGHYDYKFYKKACFNTSIYTLDTKEDGIIKRVKCTSNEGTLPTRLFYGKDIIWENRAPNEYCSSAVVYFLGVFPELATIYVARPESNEVIRRQRKNGKWITVYKDDYIELLKSLKKVDPDTIKSGIEDDELIDAEFEDDILNVFLEDSLVFKAEQGCENGITYMKYTPEGGFKIPLSYSPNDKVVRVHISSDFYCSEVMIRFDQYGPRIASVRVNDLDVELSVYHENASGIWKGITAAEHKKILHEMTDSPSVPREIVAPQSQQFVDDDDDSLVYPETPTNQPSRLNLPTVVHSVKKKQGPKSPLEDIIDLKEELSHKFVNIRQDGDYNIFTRSFTVRDSLRIVRVVDGGKNIWKVTEDERSCFKVTADYLNRIPMFVTLYIRGFSDEIIVKSLSIKGDQWVVMDTSQPAIKLRHSIEKNKTLNKLEETALMIAPDSILHDEFLLVASSSSEMGGYSLQTKENAVLNLADVDVSAFIATSYGDDMNKTYKLVPNTRHSIYMIIDGQNDVWGSDEGDTCVAVWYSLSRNYDPMVRVLIVNSKKFYHKIFRKFHNKWTQICLDTYYLTYKKRDMLDSFDINIREPSTAYHSVDGRHYGVPYRLFLMSATVKLTRIIDKTATIWHGNNGEYCIDFITNYGRGVTYLTATILRPKGALVIFFVKDGGIWATVDEKYYLDRYKLHSYDSVSESEIMSHELLALQKTGPVTLYLDDVDSSIFTEEEKQMEGGVSCTKYICKSGTQISKIVSYNDPVWEVPSDDDYCTETVVYSYDMEPQFLELEYKDSKNSAVYVYRLREYGSWIPATHTRYEMLLKEFKNDIDRVELNILDVDEEVFNIRYTTRGEAKRNVITMKPHYRLGSVRCGTNKFWRSESTEYCKKVVIYLEGDYPHLCSLMISQHGETEMMHFFNRDLIFEIIQQNEYNGILENMKVGKFLPKAESALKGSAAVGKVSSDTEVADHTLNIADFEDSGKVDSMAIYLDSVYTTLLFPKKTSNIVRIIEDHDVIWESKNQEKCVYIMCHHKNNKIYLINILKETPSDIEHKFFWRTPTDSWKSTIFEYGRQLENGRVANISNDVPVLNIRNTKNYKCKLIDFYFHGIPTKIHIPQRVIVRQIVDNGLSIFRGSWERCIMATHHMDGATEFLYFMTVNNLNMVKVHYYLKSDRGWKPVDSSEYNLALAISTHSRQENKPSHGPSHMDTELGPKVHSTAQYDEDPAVTVDISQTNVVNETRRYAVRDVDILVTRSLEGNDFYRYTHKLGERKCFMLFSVVFGGHRTFGIPRTNGVVKVSVFYWKFAPDTPLLVEVKKLDEKAFYYANVGDNYNWRRIEDDSSRLQGTQIINILRKLNKKRDGSVGSDVDSFTGASHKTVFPGYSMYSKTGVLNALNFRYDNLPIADGSEVTIYFYGEGNSRNPSLLYVGSGPSKDTWYCKAGTDRWKEEPALAGKTPLDKDMILEALNRLSRNHNLGYILPKTVPQSPFLPSVMVKPGSVAIDISRKPLPGQESFYTVSKYPGCTINISATEAFPDFYKYKHTVGDKTFSLLSVLHGEEKPICGIDRIENISDLSAYYWKYNVDVPLLIEMTRQDGKKIYYKNLDRNIYLNWFGPFTEDLFYENKHTTLLNWNSVLNLVVPVDISVKHGSYCNNEELDMKMIVVSARNLGGELSGFTASTHSTDDPTLSFNIVSMDDGNKRQKGFEFPILSVKSLTVYFGKAAPDDPILIHIDSGKDVWYRKSMKKNNLWEKEAGLHGSSSDPDISIMKRVLLKLSPASFEEVCELEERELRDSADPLGTTEHAYALQSPGDDEKEEDEMEEEKKEQGYQIEEEYNIFVKIIYFLLALIVAVPVLMFIRQLFVS